MKNKQTLHQASKAIKQEARRALKGNRGWTAGAVLLYLVIISALELAVYGITQNGTLPIANNSLQSVIGYVALYLVDIVGGVLLYGMCSIHLALQYGQPTGMRDLLRGFRENTLSILIIRAILCLLIAIVQIPFEFYYDRILSVSPLEMITLLAPLWISVIILAIGNFYISLTYALVWYLLLDYPELSWLEAMRTSRQLMKGNRKVLLYVELSFLPLYLLSILTLGIAGLWVAAYQNAAEAAFYRGIILAKKRQNNA